MMKKRFLGIILVLTLCLGLTISALASEEAEIAEEPTFEEDANSDVLAPEIDGAQSGGYTYSVYYGEATITKYNGSDTCIDIPSSMDGYPVTGIGYEAFFHCTSLTSVTVPDSVTSIEAHAFWMCTNLETISLPEGIKNIGSWMFWDCPNLKTVNIPNSVSSIDWEAFKSCTSLEEVSLPNSLTTIASGAFSGCTSLKEINIPDGVTSIGSEAFRSCSSLTNVSISGSIIKIEQDTFYECTSLKEVTIPKSVTQISEGAFWNDANLTDVYYVGSEADWAKITIGDHNAPLNSATIHYTDSGETPAPGDDKTSEAAYKAYLKAWLNEELKVNSSMTREIVDYEFIPLIEAGDYISFPAEMMFSGMLVSGKAMTYYEFVAAGGVYDFENSPSTPDPEPSPGLTIPPSDVQGDMDGDGKLTPNDAAIILKICAGESVQQITDSNNNNNANDTPMISASDLEKNKPPLVTLVRTLTLCKH